MSPARAPRSSLRFAALGAAIPEKPPQTATPFGKYLLIKRLAMGGMAELFLAQQPPSPELIVLKRILPYLSEEPEFVQMFLDEARIAAQLHHPNIVQTFELGRINESIFIAMEYVEGVDLRRILAEETRFSASVPYAVAARICAQVSGGLEYAHNSKGVDGRPLGLIHRDVSPQNVMVAYNGDVKLVDFGIAKAEAIAERSKPGVIKGKFLYLSPEQVMQERLDHRSDIFALGVMLYEITTGRAPFSRPNTEGILYAIRSENPTAPHLLRDGYPAELSRIVMKCLVKDRNQRYQRAAHVQADLEALLASGTMKQSQDVAAYIARLLGAEEERTQLHVPIPGARRESPAAAPPAGLSARPSLRTPAHGPPPSRRIEEEDPATEMARPRDMLAAAAALGDDDGEPTAIGPVASAPPSDQTNPSGRRLSRVDARQPENDVEDGESTTQERHGRASGAIRRSGLLPRKPLPSLASLDRRRGPPVQDEEEDESYDDESYDEQHDDGSAQSLSVSTLNERGPARGFSARYEDSDSDSDSESTVDLSSTDGAYDDDSSSTLREGRGGGGTRALPVARPGRRRWLLGALLALGVLALMAAAAAWWFSSSRPPAPVAAREVPPPPTPEPEPSTPEPVPTGTGTPAPPVDPAPVDTLPPPTEPSVPPDTGSVANPAGPDPVPSTGTPPPEGGETATAPPQAPTSAVQIRVQFKAPTLSKLWVGAQEVKPNDFLSVSAGTIQVRYRCPGYRGDRGVHDFPVPEQPTRPVVYTLDCKGKGRR